LDMTVPPGPRNLLFFVPLCVIHQSSITVPGYSLNPPLLPFSVQRPA
jgi:hypothetical protein